MKSETIHLTINGKPSQLDGSPTVAEFLAGKGFKPTQVVVERNGEVLQRASLAHVHLTTGDRLEVIVPVAGG